MTAVGFPDFFELFDENGYPTQEALDYIQDFPFDAARLEEILDFAGTLWHWPDYWVKTSDCFDDNSYGGKPYIRYVFHTGGWSGNEDVVTAMEENMLIKMMAPYSWSRGGHYEYRIPTYRREQAR